LVRKHARPRAARLAPRAAHDRDSHGCSARGEFGHHRVRRSPGAGLRGHEAERSCGDFRRAAHERRNPTLCPPGRLGRDTRGHPHARRRWAAPQASLRPMTRVGVDVGGTFTDLVAVGPNGNLEIRKVASTPQDPSVGLQRSLDALGAEAIDVLVHGTTVATNALLERRGARVVLVTTAGFEDLLWLRRQDRAALYDLAKAHPAPLVAQRDVIGAHERMGPDGVITTLSDAEVERVAAAVRALQPESVAIALLFAFRHPEHERRLAMALRAALTVPVTASHEILPVFREYERTSTTTAEAYLRPRVADYLVKTEAMTARKHVRTLRIMTSSGGTLAPA